MTYPPGTDFAPRQSLRARYDGRNWDEATLDSPWLCPASTTTTRQQELSPGIRGVLLALAPAANVTSVTVTGLGSNLVYLNAVAPPASGLLLIPVYPALDQYLTVSVVVNSTGQAVCYMDGLYELPTSLILASAPGPLGPFPAGSALNDTDANPNTTRIGANVLGWDEVDSEWVRVRAIAHQSGLSGGLEVVPYGLNAGATAWESGPRFADGSTDAQSLTSMLMALNMLYNGTNATRWRVLSTLADGLGVALAMPPSLTPAGQTATHASNAYTITGVSGQQVRLGYLVVSVLNAPAANLSVTVTDGTTTLTYIVGQGVTPLLSVGQTLKFAVGQSVVITVPDGGVGNTTTIDAGYMFA